MSAGEPTQGWKFSAQPDEFLVLLQPGNCVGVGVVELYLSGNQPRILWMTKDAEEAATIDPNIIPIIHLVRRVSI